jgi:hypothetical protein
MRTALWKMNSTSPVLPKSTNARTQAAVVGTAERPRAWATRTSCLEESNLNAIATALPDMEAPLHRGAAVVTLWESMLEGRFPPDKLMQVLLAALPRESDELNVGRDAGLRAIAVLAVHGRRRPHALAPEIEKVLRDGVYRSPSTSLKAAWFGALRSVATTPETLAWLTKVWKREGSAGEAADV